MIEHHLIVEAYNTESHSRECSCSLLILHSLLLLVVVTTIHLHDKDFVQADKVYDVIPDDMLTIELCPPAVFYIGISTDVLLLP